MGNPHWVRVGLWVVVASLLVGAARADAVTIFVNASLTTGADNGTSWENAFRGRDALTRALVVARVTDQIWVAAGTYTPVLPASQGGSGLRTTSFALKNNVQILGGFSGTETLATQRDTAANPTILSGDINGDDAPYPSTVGWGDNSFHVVTAGYPDGGSVNSTAVLDGFTIRGGNANGAAASNHDRGGGISCLNGSAPTLRNLTIINNRVTFGGGGLYLNASSPRVETSRLESNTGGSFGGGCDMAFNCNPIFDRCVILGNTASRAGGVEVFGNCAPQFLSCIIARNTAIGSNGGGAIFLNSATPAFRACTIVNNLVIGGGPGSAVSGSGCAFTNCIIAFNSGAAQFNGTHSQSFSCVPGGSITNGNIDAVPLFVNPIANDFRLAPNSPGIDAGSNALVTAAMLTDLAGQSRRIDDPAVADTGSGNAPVVDMGAHERVPPPPPCPADFNADGTLDPDDLSDFIAAYFRVPPDLLADFNADGTLDPDDLSDFIAAYFQGC